jgi:hypothetical protein
MLAAGQVGVITVLLFLLQQGVVLALLVLLVTDLVLLQILAAVVGVVRVAMEVSQLHFQAAQAALA